MVFKKWFIHELLFICFLFLSYLRLVGKGGFNNIHALIYGFYIFLTFFVVYLDQKYPHAWLRRARLFWFALLMNIVFVHMRWAIPVMHPLKDDLLLQAWDRWLIGGNLSLGMQAWAHPLTTEFLSFCYALFIPYLYISLLWYISRPINIAERFYMGLFSLYAIGFIGYSFFPALGPYLAMRGAFTQPLEGGTITYLNQLIYPSGTNYCDVFPSLHCAVSAYMLFFDRRYEKLRYYIYLLPCVGLWVSTVYLRYHYFVDVVAGFILAGLALAIAFYGPILSREKKCL